MIIEPINPFYLQALLSSYIGEKIYTGGAIPTITLEKLKKMIIPLPPLEEQMDIANAYAATTDELVMLNRKTERVKNRLKNIFDKGE